MIYIYLNQKKLKNKGYNNIKIKFFKKLKTNKKCKSKFK